MVDVHATRRVLVTAREEILSLQRANEIFAAKIDVLDLLSAIVRGPHRGGAMHPDPVWMLNEQIAELEQEIAKMDAAERVREQEKNSVK